MRHGWRPRLASLNQDLLPITSIGKSLPHGCTGQSSPSAYALRPLRFSEGSDNPMKQLENKVAVITGASSGIGRGIAELFAAEGAKTVIVARREAVLNEVASGIRAKGREAVIAAADVTEESDAAAVFAKAVKAYGRVDILVNNAGVAAGKPIDEMTLEYWNDVVAANMTSVFLMSRAAVKQVKGQTPQGGRIINMGSVSTRGPSCPTPCARSSGVGKWKSYGARYA